MAERGIGQPQALEHLGSINLFGDRDGSALKRNVNHWSPPAGLHPAHSLVVCARSVAKRMPFPGSSTRALRYPSDPVKRPDGRNTSHPWTTRERRWARKGRQDLYEGPAPFPVAEEITSRP